VIAGFLLPLMTYASVRVDGAGRPATLSAGTRPLVRLPATPLAHLVPLGAMGRVVRHDVVSVVAFGLRYLLLQRVAR
jgi:hypothetical protein